MNAQLNHTAELRELKAVSELLPSRDTIAERLENQRTAIFDMTALIESVVLAIEGMDRDGGPLYPLFRTLRLAGGMSEKITEALEPVTLLSTERDALETEEVAS